MTAEAERAIAETVRRWTGGRGNPAALIAIARRESGLNPRAVGDVQAAARAYERTRDRLRNEGNPWADEPGRWAGSFGLFQLMPAYWLRLSDPKADPHSLFNPEVATIVAARMWNRAVKAGARDFVGVRLYWANPSWVRFQPGDVEYDKRLDRHAIVDGEMNPPAYAYDYSAFGVGPSENASTPAQSAGISPLALAILAWKGWQWLSKLK